MKNSYLIFLIFFISLCATAEKRTFEVRPSLTLIGDSEYLSEDHFGDGSGEVNSFLRRARSGLSATFYDLVRLKFSVQYNDDDGSIDLRDSYLSFNANKSIKLTMGRFNEPLGMESALSVKWQAFHERSIATRAFFLGRQDGLLVENSFHNWSLNLGVFLMYNERPDEDTSPAYIANLSHYSKPFSMFKFHWGLGASQRDGFLNSTRFESDYLSRNSGKEIRSRRIDAKELTLYRQEAAAATKTVSLRTEFFQQLVTTTQGLEQEFSGFYASASWNFIGKGYAYKDNVFQLKKSKKLSMEAAIRYSEVDLVFQGEGDQGSSLNLALNVYWSKRYKASLEYEHGEIVELDEGLGSPVEDDAIKLRMQLNLK